METPTPTLERFESDTWPKFQRLCDLRVLLNTPNSLPNVKPIEAEDRGKILSEIDSLAEEVYLEIVAMFRELGGKEAWAALEKMLATIGESKANQYGHLLPNFSFDFFAGLYKGEKFMRALLIAATQK